MIGALQRAFDTFAGRGEAAVTVPPMDGALRPNTALEDAALVVEAPAPDNLFADRGEIWFSSGTTLRAIGGAAARHYDAVITCAAADGAGRIAVGLEDGRVIIEAAGAAPRVIDRLGDGPLRCPTALAFDGDALLLCEGSREHPPSLWQRDLMARGSAGAASGSVWRIAESGAPVCLARGLGWPYGLLAQADGSVIISEAWRHRLLLLPADGGSPVPVLSDLPGYPARLSPGGPAGGAWLAVFAPRSQLIEFVLREPGYRARMMAEVPMDYWIAPALYSGRSFLEPLQGGAVKQMGILKPWAPTRSYGLVLHLDDAFQPIASLHSRADGTRHGVTSVLADGGRVLACAKGGDVIVACDIHAGEEDAA
jgi:hypothetical protein